MDTPETPLLGLTAGVTQSLTRSTAGRALERVNAANQFHFRSEQQRVDSDNPVTFYTSMQ